MFSAYFPGFWGRRILDVFEVFLGIFEKTKEKKGRIALLDLLAFSCLMFDAPFRPIFASFEPILSNFKLILVHFWLIRATDIPRRCGTAQLINFILP